MLLRPNTADKRAWNEAYVRNDYFLPDRFQVEDVILDIGAHIGSFTLAALERGARHIWAFEPDTTNYALALCNLRDHLDHIHLVQAAVWRADVPSAKVYFSGYKCENPDDLINTGGGDVMFPSAGVVVRTISFDDAVDAASAGGTHRIRLVKFDCEGSEFPILYTSRRLDLIDEIVGEYHAVRGDEWMNLRPDSRIETLSEYAPNGLCEHLTQSGFVARFGHGSRKQGQFLAWRSRTV